MKIFSSVYFFATLLALINCADVFASDSSIVQSRNYLDLHTNVFSILKDDLPSQIDSSEIQLAFLIPTEECQEIGANQFLSPMKFYCVVVNLSIRDEKFSQYNPIKIPIGRSANSVTEIISTSTELSRRYIALIDWYAHTFRASASYSNLYFVTEEVLYDRLEKKLIWHAISKGSSLTSNATNVAEISPPFIEHILKSTANMTQRGQIIGKGKRYNYSPLVRSEIKAKLVGGNGRIVLLNNYFRIRTEGVRRDSFKVLKASENIDGVHNKFNFGLDFMLGYKSYAAFDLEPGTYVLICNGKVAEEFTLKSGDLLNYKHSRGFLNRNVISEISSDEVSVEIEKYTNGILADTNDVDGIRFTRD